jgi:hypothetical protein
MAAKERKEHKESKRGPFPLCELCVLSWPFSLVGRWPVRVSDFGLLSDFYDGLSPVHATFSFRAQCYLQLVVEK